LGDSRDKSIKEKSDIDHNSPLPTGLAITIIICLLIAVAGLWSFVFTGKMIAMWIGALGFVTSGAVAFRYLRETGA
jgi:hypothetical protein